MKLRIVIFFVFFMAWLALPAWGQAGSTTLLDDLASDRYDVRERATDLLLSDRTRSINDIVHLYAAAVTPEQRYRLLAVAMHYTSAKSWMKHLSPTDPSFKTEAARPNQLKPAAPAQNQNAAIDPAQAGPWVPDSRACLGVFLGGGLPADLLPRIGQSAVCINSVYPGFPAYGILHPGDLVTQVDHQPLPVNGSGEVIRDAFRKMIQEQTSGSEFTLRVFRQNQWLDVKLRSVNLELLSSVYYPPDSVMANSESLQPPYLERWLQVRQRMPASGQPLPPLVVNLNALAIPTSASRTQ